MIGIRRCAFMGCILSLTLLLACNKSQPTAQCDCSVFPPKLGCDTTCGIATGVVESVSGNSVVIKVPVIEPPQAATDTPAEATIQRRTFTVNSADASQMNSLKPGSRVAFTFKQEQGQQVVKSVQPLAATSHAEAHP